MHERHMVGHNKYMERASELNSMGNGIDLIGLSIIMVIDGRIFRSV
jgi:hypothetical protein